jgi:hypothetical protein
MKTHLDNEEVYMGKSKIIYIPDFEECLIQKKELHDWEHDPILDYFTSFEEAREEMISYWQNVRDKAQVFLKEARKIKIVDCV